MILDVHCSGIMKKITVFYVYFTLVFFKQKCMYKKCMHKNVIVTKRTKTAIQRANIKLI